MSGTGGSLAGVLRGQGSLSSAGASSSVFTLYGSTGLWISASAGASFTAQLQVSRDSGVSWVPASLDSSGDPANYSASTYLMIQPPVYGLQWVLAITAYSSGTIYYAVDQSWVPPPGRFLT